MKLKEKQGIILIFYINLLKRKGENLRKHNETRKFV